MFTKMNEVQISYVYKTQNIRTPKLEDISLGG